MRSRQTRKRVPWALDIIVNGVLHRLTYGLVVEYYSLPTMNRGDRVTVIEHWATHPRERRKEFVLR